MQLRSENELGPRARSSVFFTLPSPPSLVPFRRHSPSYASSVVAFACRIVSGIECPGQSVPYALIFIIIAATTTIIIIINDDVAANAFTYW